MNLEVSAEKNGLRVKALIVTHDLNTHSALQDVDKDYVDAILRRIQIALTQLLAEAAAVKKP
jgi:hypothetical protein